MHQRCIHHTGFRIMSRRPELTGPPDLFYDAKEARKYTSSSRIISVQADIADRCIELLDLPPGAKRLILDIGCGSGLSGAALEAAGHEWIGCDISPDMLRIASERVTEEDDEDSDEEDDDDDEELPPAPKRRKKNRSAELIEHDMGEGLPFREGTFDGAISVSAIQWLCYDNDASQSAPKRLARFFGSLYACLKKNSRAALQFYPQDEAQATLIATAAARAGFAGGIVTDFPNSAKAKKCYLCLSMDRSYRKPEAKQDEGPKKGNSKKKEWVLRKKEHQRRQGRQVRPDSKYTGRKRKDRF